MSYALIAVGLVVALGGVLARTKLPKALGMLIVAVGTGMVAAGGLQLTGDATPADWIIAIPGAIAGAVFHAMVVLGPFGPPEPSVG